jgi:Flp pilus assembly protein TadG
MCGWSGKAMFGRFHSFWRDESGVSLIEFAAIAPFLGIMIVGMADLGRGYTERFFLQKAVNRTIELAHHGTKTNDYNFLIAEAATAAAVPVANVTLEQWLECDGGTPKAFTSTCSSGQQTARYVRLTVRKSFDPLFTTAGYPNVQADGTVRLQADASLRVQ